MGSEPLINENPPTLVESSVKLPSPPRLRTGGVDGSMARLLLGPGGDCGGSHRFGVRRGFHQPAGDRLRAGLRPAWAGRGSPDPVGRRADGVHLAAGAWTGQG